MSIYFLVKKNTVSRLFFKIEQFYLHTILGHSNVVVTLYDLGLVMPTLYLMNVSTYLIYGRTFQNKLLFSFGPPYNYARLGTNNY